MVPELFRNQINFTWWYLPLTGIVVSFSHLGKPAWGHKLENLLSRIHVLCIIALLFTINILALSSPAQAQTSPPAFSPEIRLLFHGVKTIVDAPEEGSKPSVGLAVWLIEPNLLDTTPQTQATAGIRLARPDAWVEILGGGVFSPTTDSPITPVFDLRAFTAPTRHLHLFGEVSTYTDALYGFAQVDVPLRKADGNVVAKIGVEIEGAKAWEGPGGLLAGGPHVIIPWNNHFTTVIACQVRGTHSPAGPPATDLVGRIYAVIDF